MKVWVIKQRPFDGWTTCWDIIAVVDSEEKINSYTDSVHYEYDVEEFEVE